MKNPIKVEKKSKKITVLSSVNGKYFTKNTRHKSVNTEESFGWVKGAILSWSSAMAGAALCFFLARALGRDAVEKLTSRGAMESVDVFFERYGKYAILICRLLPFVSFDFVSYGAGLTNMGFWPFFIATGIGQLPATIVYSYVGGTLTGGAQKLFLGLLTLFALSIMIGIAKKVYNDKQKKKGEKVVE